MKIVLASSSPRRKELLQTAGINFEIDVEGVDEVPQGDTPEEKVCSIAAQKCRPVAARRPNDCVIGADTVVSVDGDILGKPHDREDAKNMLRRLSGREHTVYTGVCISAHGKETVFSEATKVKFFELTDNGLCPQRRADGQSRSLRHTGTRLHARRGYRRRLLQCRRSAGRARGARDKKITGAEK